MQPPVQVTAQRLIYDRQKLWMRAEGGTKIRRGQDRLAAVRIYGNLSDDETGLKFVHAFWDIEGETHSTTALGRHRAAAQPTTVRFRRKDLAVVFQPEGNQARRVELRAPEDGRVQMESDRAAASPAP